MGSTLNETPQFLTDHWQAQVTSLEGMGLWLSLTNVGIQCVTVNPCYSRKEYDVNSEKNCSNNATVHAAQGVHNPEGQENRVLTDASCPSTLVSQCFDNHYFLRQTSSGC